ncbi:hypothetical protein B7494_g2563 [Chlorociboria aeruginascens]|nr:hypothetical protein B7494_g2563 [Chlorociboria aeruginascens]
MSETRCQQACSKLQAALRERSSREARVVKDAESFQSVIAMIFKAYSDSNAPAIFEKKLLPHLGHLESLENAVSMSPAIKSASSLVWFSAKIEQIVDSMVAFYEAVPDLSRHVTHIPNNSRLQVSAVKGLLSNPQHNAQTHITTMLTSSRTLQVIPLAGSRLLGKKADNTNLERCDPAAVISSKSHYLVPTRRDPSFCGRNTILGEIHKSLLAPKPSATAEAQSVLIYGLSGIGKTSTALEYTYRYRDSFDFVFWMVAETKSDLVRSYAQVIARLRALGLIQNDGSTGIDDARDWFEITSQTWLLVLDNVEDWPSILHYWPTSAKAQSAILVTAQKQEFRHLTSNSFLLEDLSIDDGSQLLLAHVNQGSPFYDDELKAAKKITEMFGGLPLAIAHIAGYVSDSPCSLSDFLEITELRYAYIWDSDVTVSKAQSKKRLNVVWDVALDELPLDARKLIYTMAFMNPDLMPDAIFLARSDLEDPELKKRKAEFIEMMRCLVKRALVRPIAESQGLYSIHRALQKYILYKLDKDLTTRHEFFLSAIAAIRMITPSASPTQTPNPKLWDQFEMAVPQILALQAAFVQSEPHMKGSEAFAQLLYDAAFNTWERESSHDGLRLLTTAQAVLDELEYDPDGKLRADILVMQGVTCDNIGISKRKEALQVREIAVRVRQMVVNRSQGSIDVTDDILLHNALNDTAESHLQYYDYQQADLLIETCRKRYTTWGTEEEYPFEYGKYYRNKALVYTLQGRFTDAITAARRSVKLAEQDTGVGPRYLLYLQDVASHLLQSRDIHGALTQHMEVFKLRERICGKYHDVTLQSAYAVASMYYHLGEMAKAEEWFRRTLERAERTRWPEEPLCRAQFHLAQVIRLQPPGDEGAKRMKEAADLETKAKEVLNRLLKYDLPDFLKRVDDDLVLFDHLQPCFRGRWTGMRLLHYFNLGCPVASASFLMSHGRDSRSSPCPSGYAHVKRSLAVDHVLTSVSSTRVDRILPDNVLKMTLPGSRRTTYTTKKAKKRSHLESKDRKAKLKFAPFEKNKILSGKVGSQYKTSLFPNLQYKIRRDPKSYSEDFLNQYGQYQSQRDIFLASPGTATSTGIISFRDLIDFIAHVADCFPEDTAQFPEDLKTILTLHHAELESELREKIVGSLVLLRRKDIIDSAHLLNTLFPILVATPSKTLRTLLFQKILSDLRTSNSKSTNHRLNRTVQMALFNLLTSDRASSKGIWAVKITRELWKRHIWTDSKAVEIMKEAALVDNEKVIGGGVRFFLGGDKEREELDDESSDDEGGIDIGKLKHQVGINKKTKKKAKTVERAVEKVKKAEKKKKQPHPLNFSALHLLHDPQGFAEMLFSKHLQNSKSKLNLEQKLLVLQLVSRLVGLHKLTVISLYSYFIKYLTPRQQSVTSFLASLAQATHNLVPPDALEPLVQKIANEFVSEASASEVASAGLNAIREICVRQPLAMNDTLLQDLVMYRKSKDKGTMMAAKGLLSLYREVGADLLKKRDRGKTATIGIKSGQIKERRFGEEEVGGIEGLELLEQWKDEERKRKRVERGLPEELGTDEEEEDEEEQDWNAWDVESDATSDSGGWINVESNAEIEISDSEDDKPTAKKVKLDTAAKIEEKENDPEAQGRKISKLATTKVLTPADLAKLQELRLQSSVSAAMGHKNSSQRSKELAARHIDDPLTAEQIEGLSKMRKSTKEEMIALAREGKGDRGEHKSTQALRREKKDAEGKSTTNKEKARKKNFMMTLGKAKFKQKRSLTQTRRVLKGHIERSKRGGKRGNVGM